MSSNPPELGPDRRGPDFAPPGFGGPAGPGQQSGPWQAPYGDPYQDQQYRNQQYQNQQYQNQPYRNEPPGQRPRGPEPPRPNRKPAFITAAVIGLVVLIVVIASIHAFRGDKQVVREESSPRPTPSPSALPSDSPNSISFTSSEGSGRLTLVSHDWATDGAQMPRYGQFLQVQLKISATAGRVSYGPEFFQTFDETGNLFQTTEVGARPPLLGDGVLHPGQSTTGDIAFDMPRGAVTLLMSNSLLESVTALRISD